METKRWLSSLISTVRPIEEAIGLNVRWGFSPNIKTKPHRISTTGLVLSRIVGHMFLISFNIDLTRNENSIYPPPSPHLDHLCISSVTFTPQRPFQLHSIVILSDFSSSYMQCILHFSILYTDQTRSVYFSYWWYLIRGAMELAN